MSSKDIRVRFVRRDVPDISKLAEALLDLVASLDAETRERLLTEDTSPSPARTGNPDRLRKGEAA